MSGLAALLAMLALMLLRTASAGRGSAAARCAAARARLCAESGMDYAASRLMREDTFPRYSPTAADRGDDWAERRGSDNPSYSHGESWIEKGVPDGIFTPSETRHADRDADGRLGAWSGRLRGGSVPSSLRFALRIESADGKIPLNAGDLTRKSDAFQIFGSSYYRTFTAGNPYYQGLVQALDNLGFVCGISTRREEIATPGKPVRFTRLGQDLLSRGPVGGYRSWKEVEEKLLDTYTKAELDAVRPHIDLGPYGDADPLGRVRVNLWTASREVLQSLWMNLGCWPGEPMTDVSRHKDAGFCIPGERAAWTDAFCPYTAAPFGTAPCLLWPEDAEALADVLIELRAAGSLSWKGLREALSLRAEALFPDDAAALASFPVFRRSWTGAKANLAFQIAAMDRYRCPSYNGRVGGMQRNSLRSWADWGVDPPGVWAYSLFRIPYPASTVLDVKELRVPPGLTNLIRVEGGQPLLTDGLERVDPLGGTLAPPLCFHVRSACAGTRGEGACVIEGRLRTRERLDLFSQENFECRNGKAWAEKGIDAAVDSPPPDVRRDAAGGARPRIVSLPNAAAESVYPSSDPMRVGWYHRDWGALALAAADCGRGDALLYWPCVQDFDGMVNLQRPPWIGFWPDFEPAPAPAWGTGLSSPSYPAMQAQQKDPYFFQLECPNPPGIRTVPSVPGWKASDPIREMTVETWISPGNAVFHLKKHFSKGTWMGTSIQLSRYRGFLDPVRPGTCFSLEVEGLNSKGWPAISSATWVVEDDPSRPGWHTHLVLALRLEGSGTKADPYRTVFTLRVNGSSQSASGPMVHVHDGSRWVTWRYSKSQWDGSLRRGGEATVGSYYETSWFQGVDKLRIYEEAREELDPPRRFVERGTYTSPLFAPDAPFSLLLAQWTGIVPPGAPSTVIHASVTGYRDREGNEEAAMIPLPAAVAESVPADLARLGMPAGIRSFRYRVELKRPSGIDDTPLFESIWFAFQRRGMPPWTAWAAR